MACGARSALPGGHDLGEQLYFTGPNHSFEDGDKLTHGKQGEVVGPATGEHQGNGLKLLFTGNTGPINCYLPWLSREKPPPLPGDHYTGEQLYFTGPSQSFESGDKLTHGQSGEVVGPATTAAHQGNGLKMQFPGNKVAINCSLPRLSREKPPPLPGGHRLGDRLYYTGVNKSFKSGNKLMYGQQGAVVGPATDKHQGNGLKLQFPGNRSSQSVNIASLSRDDPCAVSSVPENVLRARRALAARREEQERAAAAAASRAAEDNAAEAERRQQLAAELLEEEAAAKAQPPLQEAGRRRRKKQSGFRGSRSSTTEGAEGSADCSDSTSRAAPARESASESDEEERVTPAEEARRAEESERAARQERQARLLEAARREREERLEREARAEAAAAAAAESEARGRRQQAARAAEEERKRAVRQALVDEMEAQARQEEAVRAAAPLRTTQAEQSSTRLAIEQALSQARSDAAVARVREATAGSEAEQARLEAEAARAREEEARGREEAARSEAEEATAREEALTVRLAALELGPPPAASPPTAANNAVGGDVGSPCRATLPQKVSRICAHLGLDARSSLSAAVAAANESTGVAAEGGLLQQVDRLIAMLFGGPQTGAPEES